jgi:PleD family two-component response regulator
MKAFMKNVLIIEEDPSYRRLLKSVLQQLGAQYEEATDAVEALKQISKAAPHLIIMDINLPDNSGLGLLKKIRSTEETSKVPIVIFSSTTSIELIMLLKRIGISDFIVHNLEISKIQEKLEKVLVSVEV